MGKVIEFLERVGQDASLRYASRESLAIVLDAEGCDAAMRAMLMSNDADAFQLLLGTRVFSSSQMPIQPEEEKIPDEDEDDDDEDGDGRPDGSLSFGKPH